VPWTIAAFTAPKHWRHSSRQTRVFECLIRPIAPTWHLRTFGFSVTGKRH
jgi:hypothetical protein